MSILRQIADRRMNNAGRAQTEINEEKLIPFDFEGNSYYLALRESLLVFDSDKNLLYTIEYDTVEGEGIPLFSKAMEIALAVRQEQEASYTKLYVKRNGRFEHLSFVRKFDATFIFMGLKRVAVRGVENIEEIYMERNGITLERFDAVKAKEKHPRGIRGRRRSKFEMADAVEKTPVVNTLIEVQSNIESIIGAKVQDAPASIDSASIDKCIELLEKAKAEL